MKQITLNIPDDKYTFFLELLQSLRFVSFERETNIPEEHKPVAKGQIKRSSQDAGKFSNETR